jgi:uncharacterized protein (TIGR02453 family)
MTFAGFHSDAFAFYDELAEHNTREWWLANKKRYDEHVRGPVAALVEQLGTEFGAIKIFRPNRDVRFSSDKSPYKTQISFVTQTATGAAHYLQLGSDGVMIAGGYYQPASDRLCRFRALDRILDAWRTISSWNDWLAENVGPSVNPPRSGPGGR